MPTSEERKPFHHSRRPVVMLIFLLFLGLQGLYSVIYSSHFASYRTVDVMRLVDSGACLGGVLALSFAWWFLGPRD